jgi:phage shock protein A
VPEVYEAFQLPDGVEIDAKAIELASPVFKELGLTQENAQKVVGLYTELTKQLDERIATQRAETIADWLKQAKADKEIGGAKWSKSLEQAQSIVNKYADAETRQFLEETGLGNHPGLIKMLAKAGANFSEGSFVAQGANDSRAARTLEQVFYPESAAGK